MSLVSTYVVMADGKYYQNPVIYDETGDWFICFDDEEPPEFVIRTNVISSSRKDREKEILERLEEIGISAEIIQSDPSGQRNFSLDSKMSFYAPAIRAFLKLNNRIPLSRIKVKADSISDKLKIMECVVCDPEFKEEDYDIR